MAIFSQRRVRVTILLFEGVEVLDFAGPFEVFVVAGRLASVMGLAGVEVVTTARDVGTIRARAGLAVLPSSTFENCGPTDVLVIPGGIVDEPLRCRHTRAWIRNVTSTSIVTASVCTGAFLLAEAGLLDGRCATTHWEDAEALAAAYPKVSVDSTRRYVDEGSVWTSAGVSAGLDMLLRIVGKLFGAAAEATAHQVDYPFGQDGSGAQQDEKKNPVER